MHFSSFLSKPIIFKNWIQIEENCCYFRSTCFDVMRTGFSLLFLGVVWTESLRSQIILQLPLGQCTFKGKNKVGIDLFAVSWHLCKQQHSLCLHWDITSLWADTPVYQMVITTFMRNAKWAVGKAFIPYIFFKYKYTENNQLKCHKNTEGGRTILLPHYIKPQSRWPFLKGRLFEQNCSRKLRLSYSQVTFEDIKIKIKIKDVKD